MSSHTLIMGNVNYSSWSLRPWLALKAAGVAFDTVVIPLQTPETKSRILSHSPAGKVPILRTGNRLVWDSLAICEYVAERWPEAGLWPTDPDDRADARCISAEMHAGFQALREHMPMNVRARHPGCGMTDSVAVDVQRIGEIWAGCRARFGDAGPFLFGSFSIADCMYAPVVFRFRTYMPELPDEASQYMSTMLAHPAMREWDQIATNEAETIPAHDNRYAT